MIEGRTVLSLLAKTLATGLYITLHKLMGLNFMMLSGDFTFGIRVILVWLISFGILQSFKQYRTAAYTSSPIKVYKD